MLIDFGKHERRILIETNKLVRDVAKVYDESLEEVTDIFGVAYNKYDGDIVEFEKYNRLESLDKAIVGVASVLAVTTGKRIMSGMKDVYRESYYTSAYEVDKTVGVPLGFSRGIGGKVQTAMNNPADTLTQAQRNRKNVQAMTAQVKQEMLSGLRRGESYKEIARTLQNRFDMSKTVAERLVRTECHRVEVQAQYDCMGDAIDKGVYLKKQWRSTLDSRTRDGHQGLDGETITMAEMFVSSQGGVGPKPGEMNNASDDINCRCGLNGIIEGFEPKVRMAREKAGQRGELIDKVSYKQWKGKHLT